MFKTATELKEFIIWARTQHIKRLKVGDIEIEVSEIAFIPEYQAPITSNITLPETEKAEVNGDDPDLYFSVSN